MIKAIVLDVGGVLLRTEDRSGREYLEKKYGLKTGGVDHLVFNSPEARASTVGLASPDAIWQSIADELSLDQPSLRIFKRAFWQGDRVDEDLLQFITTCHPQYTTAILSNAWLNARKALADTYQIKQGQTVDHILISSELGVAKPDPIIYQILSDTINCRYPEILFVDDFPENIEAAKNLGIQTIHYQTGMNLINEIKSSLRND